MDIKRLQLWATVNGERFEILRLDEGELLLQSPVIDGECAFVLDLEIDPVPLTASQSQ